MTARPTGSGAPPEDDPALLRAACAARDRQIAELRGHLADLAATAELATADAASHAREADAQRTRADGAEREAIAQRDRADRLEGLLGEARAATAAAQSGVAARAEARLRRVLRRPGR